MINRTHPGLTLIRFSEGQWCPGVGASSLTTALPQELSYVLATRDHCLVERRAAFLIFGVHISFVGKKQICNIDRGRAMQRRSAILIFGVHISFVGQKKLCDLHRGCAMQRRPALLIFSVHISFVGKKQIHDIPMRGLA